MSSLLHHRRDRSRKVLRDYNRQRYGNPLFPRSGGRRQPFKFRSSRGGGGLRLPKRSFALALFAMLAIGGAWYVLWSPAFKVSAMEINGASAPTEEVVRKALDAHLKRSVALVLPNNNVLLFSDEAAKNEIGTLVYLESIDIRKKLPGTIIIDVREKDARAVLETEGRLLAIDESGIIIRELTEKEMSLVGDLPPGMDAVPVRGLGAESMELPEAQKEGDAKTEGQAKEEPKKKTLPLVLDRANADKKTERLPGRQVFSATTLALVLQANARLPDIAGEDIRWFTVDETAETVEAVTAAGWRIFLSAKTPFEVQAERLAIVIREKIKDQKPRLDYIDLRYNERIFYRLKEGS